MMFVVITMDALVVKANPVLTKQALGTVGQTSVRIGFDVIPTSWIGLF